jgi:phosphoglucomutase
MLTRLEPSVRQRIQTWLEGNYDAETKATIQALIDAQKRKPN